MLIIGAKGFAKEVLEVVYQCNDIENLVFYDDVNKDLPDKLFGKFEIIKNINAAVNYFKSVDKRFTIGIGNPILRKKMYDQFTALGGVLTTVISPKALISNIEVLIKEGNNILAGAILSSSVTVGKGCIVYYNAVIAHDCIIGDFVEVSPSATILGRVVVSEFSLIGANSTILPNITIGKNVIVAAGTVVTKNIPDNCMVAGVPAVIKKELTPLQF